MITNKFGEDILTVSEVIDILKQMPQDLPVWHEGCDCIGSANGIIIENGRDGDYVLITRNH